MLSASNSCDGLTTPVGITMKKIIVIDVTQLTVTPLSNTSMSGGVKC